MCHVVIAVGGDPQLQPLIARSAALIGAEALFAADGAVALRKTTEHRVTLGLVEFMLPDMSGLDFIREATRIGRVFPWVLTSDQLSLEVCVEAMRLGAHDVKLRPFDVQGVILSAGGSASAAPGTWPSRPIRTRLVEGQSAAERWAALVIRTIDAPDDLYTLRVWASFVGVSYRSLREYCSIVGVRPHDARDFARVFRALAVNGGRVDRLPLCLRVSDSRTIRSLLTRSGLTKCTSGEVITLQAFLRRQRFIDQSHDLIGTITEMAMRLHPQEGD